MGYWVVVAMVLVAVVAVLIVVLEEGGAWTSPPSATSTIPLIVLIGSSATLEDGALSPQPWTERVRQKLGNNAEVYDATPPVARASHFDGAELLAVFHRTPALAVIWLGADDFLLGTDLGTFERSVGHLLAILAAHRIGLLAIALPDLTPLITPSESADEELVAARAELRRWNATLARLATAHGARLISSSDLPPGILAPETAPAQQTKGLVLTEAGHEALASVVTEVILEHLAVGVADTTRQTRA
ncbi:MAG: hypothetical protein C4346_02125 [Chloroflexota bacterium]